MPVTPTWPWDREGDALSGRSSAEGSMKRAHGCFLQAGSPTGTRSCPRGTGGSSLALQAHGESSTQIPAAGGKEARGRTSPPNTQELGRALGSSGSSWLWGPESFQRLKSTSEKVVQRQSP